MKLFDSYQLDVFKFFIWFFSYLLIAVAYLNNETLMQNAIFTYH